MKTHTIKTPTAELLIVETTLNAKNIVFYEGDNSLTWETENHIIKGYDLDGYTLLGKPDEISEEDARELVERTGVGDPCYQGDWFVNYQDDEYMFETAKESLLSLLESEIYWDVNPFGEESRSYSEVMDGVSNDEIFEDVKDWHEAEQKTFDRNRSIIFKKKI